MKEEITTALNDNAIYDKFIRSGLAIGFTDDQIDFLWDWINKIAQLKALSGGMF
jgi:hypothetical protein